MAIALPNSLRSLVLRRITDEPLVRPLPLETEPRYTQRVLLPKVRQALEEAGTRGLVVSGDGAGPVRSVAVLGRNYYPDISISEGRRQHLAIEVKIVRLAEGQPIATGLGQAVLYLYRYSSSALLLIDVDRTLSPAEVERLDLITGEMGCAVAVASVLPQSNTDLGR